MQAGLHSYKPAQLLVFWKYKLMDAHHCGPHGEHLLRMNAVPLLWQWLLLNTPYCPPHRKNPAQNRPAKEQVKGEDCPGFMMFAVEANDGRQEIDQQPKRCFEHFSPRKRSHSNHNRKLLPIGL